MPSLVREYRFRHADGSWRWLHDEMRRTGHAVDGPLEIVGYLLDITDRRQAEIELLERKELIASMTAQAVDAIALVDLQNGRFVEFNAAAHQGLGYTREQFAGMLFADLHTHGGADALQRQFDRIRLLGSVCFEAAHLHCNGTLRDVRISARLVNLQGKDYASVIWSDITESKQATAALELSRDRLERAEELAMLGNWELNLLTGELVWSAQIFRIFEVDPELFRPDYAFFFERIHPDDRLKVDQAYKAAVGNRTDYNIQHRLLFADGRVKFVEEYGRTEYAEDGTPVRSLGTVQDITSSKTNEISMQNLLRRLQVFQTVTVLLEDYECSDHELLERVVAVLPGLMPVAQNFRAQIRYRSLHVQSGALDGGGLEWQVPLTVEGELRGSIRLCACSPLSVQDPESDMAIEILRSVARAIGLALRARGGRTTRVHVSPQHAADTFSHAATDAGLNVI